MSCAEIIYLKTGKIQAESANFELAVRNAGAGSRTRKRGRRGPSPACLALVPAGSGQDFDRDRVFRVELGIGFPRLHVNEVDFRGSSLQRAVHDGVPAADADHARRTRFLFVVVLFELEDALVDIFDLVPAESRGRIRFERERDRAADADLDGLAVVAVVEPDILRRGRRGFRFVRLRGSRRG